MFNTLITTDELASACGTAGRRRSATCATTSRNRTPGARRSTAPATSPARCSCTSTATCRRRRPAPTAAIRCLRPKPRRRLFGRLGIAAGKQVVAYDQGGGTFAARLWWMLRWLGHDAVAVLDGGYAKWTAEGRAVDDRRRGARARAVRDRAASRRPSTRPASMASLARQTLLLIDARAPERFRGETEPLDPVAGHIPGARNRPYTHQSQCRRHVQAPGVPARRVRRAARRRAARPRRPPMRVRRHRVPQHARDGRSPGLHGTRLYPGSWSEWCADPARPVADGAR